MMLESFQSLFGVLEVEQADSQTYLGFGIAGRDLQGLAEIRCGFVPASQLFQAYGQLEIRGAMMRIQLDQPLISLGAMFELLQLVLNMAHGRKQRGRVLAAVNGTL